MPSATGAVDTPSGAAEAGAHAKVKPPRIRPTPNVRVFSKIILRGDASPQVAIRRRLAADTIFESRIEPIA